MPEVEKTNDEGSTSLEDLRRENRELKAQIRDLNAEARDFRLERNDARKRVKELETENAELGKTKGGDPRAAERIKALEAENRGLKHRTVFDRVARESGAKASPKALDALWKAIEYTAEGEAVEADVRAKIEAARADYDFLFDAQGGETPAGDKGKETTTAATAAGAGGGPEKKKPETPAKPAGPGGTGRGGPADGTGTFRIRKSDLQSFDPRVNPLMDPTRASLVEKARREGKLEYVEE